MLHGDLGVSLYNRLPVADRIWSAIPNTLQLAVTSLAFALLVAVPLGVYSAVRHRSPFDHVATVSGVAMYAIPDFWLALLLVWVFALKFKDLGLPSLPVGGMVDPRGGGDFADRVEHLILPVVALSLVQIGRLVGDHPLLDAGSARAMTSFARPDRRGSPTGSSTTFTPSSRRSSPW